MMEKETLIGKAWGKVFKHNKSLIHVDMSHNHFSEEACSIIGSKLIFNHTMYGFHMEGNCCKIDSQGFIVVNEAITAAAVIASK
jgi:hypothetical protein